jgi:hypothetical protein
MKPTSAFKLSKPSKRFLASVVDKEERLKYKKLAIESQLTYEEYEKKKLRVEKTSE